MKRITAVFLWLLVGTGNSLGFLPQVPEQAAPQAAGSVAVDENVLYATANGVPLHLDVYQPAERGSAPRPAVILIHGGGWIDLDKSTMRGMGQFLARHGFVAFALDYRLFDGKENAWPAQLDDVQRAVRWVRAHAERYGVNPDRIGAFGHSAGAQLAALLGMEETRDNSDPSLAKFSSRVQAVVDVSGPTDFTTHRDPEDLAFLTRFLGADFAQHPEVWREASPVYHVAKEDAPFLIVHGTRDESVPLTQPQELLEKLQAAGVPAALIKMDDLHTFRTPEARRELALESLAFFNRNLNAPPGASHP
jgi:acetyl esterase/lipase